MTEKDLEKILGLSGRYICLTIPLPGGKRKPLWIRIPSRPLDRRIARRCIAVYARKRDEEPSHVIPVGSALWVLTRRGRWRKVAFRTRAGQVNGYAKEEDLNAGCSN